MCVNIKLSELDQARFGVKTAVGQAVTRRDAARVHEFCLSLGMELAIMRVPVEAVAAVHLLESSGALLMDTQVKLARSLEEAPPAASAPPSVRAATVADADAVAGVAARAFATYGGHYHADPRLDPAACTAVYEDWARRSVTTDGVADVVLVAELGGEIAGFSTARREGDVVEGLLDGVEPTFQRRGVYRALSIARITWAREQRAERLTVAALVTNLGALGGMAALGFRTASAQHTFHRWATG